MLAISTDCLLMNMTAADLGLIRRCTTRMPVLGKWLREELDNEAARRAAPGGMFNEPGSLELPPLSREVLAFSLQESCLAFSFVIRQPKRERVVAFFKSLHYAIVACVSDRLHTTM